MVAMSYLSDVQALINLGELEIARREVNFVKTLILDYPDMAAEVTDEELDGIYGRLVGVKSSSVETIREQERHSIRRLSIAACGKATSAVRSAIAVLSVRRSSKSWPN